MLIKEGSDMSGKTSDTNFHFLVSLVYVAPLFQDNGYYKVNWFTGHH